MIWHAPILAKPLPATRQAASRFGSETVAAAYCQARPGRRRRSRIPGGSTRAAEIEPGHRPSWPPDPVFAARLGGLQLLPDGFRPIATLVIDRRDRGQGGPAIEVRPSLHNYFSTAMGTSGILTL